jgi:hypothetical protein
VGLAVAAHYQDAEVERLEAAFVRVIVEGSYATVIAEYEIDRSGSPLVFEALRLPGQVVIVDRAFGPDGALEVRQLVDVRRIVAPAGTTGLARFRVSYRVENDFSRVPIFVPDPRAAPGSSPVRLEILGAPAEAEPADAVPPFQRGSDGALYTSTPQLPSVIRLPSPARRPSAIRITALLALLLLCVAGLVWAGQRAWGKGNRAPGGV